MKEYLEHDEDFVPIFNVSEMLAGLSELHHVICDTELEHYTDLVHDVYEYVYVQSGANYPAGFEPAGLSRYPLDIRVDEECRRTMEEDLIPWP